MRVRFLLLAGLATVLTIPAVADPFMFSTGAPDGLMGMASRPGSGGSLETEAADDFILNAQSTLLNTGTFVGLLPSNLNLATDISQVRVEIYRVFPNDSDTVRTINVPTRANSPSDVEFADRDTASNNLTYTTTLLNDAFSVANSVDNGINPKPNQTTLGEGPVRGQEVQFDVTFTTPFDLPPDHYFFIPQVQLTNGDFLWLSAPKPIVGAPFLPDLQTWIRNSNLDPDWLRVGTDIVGTGAFNGTFSLQGETVPEPSSYFLLGSALLALTGLVRKKLPRR
jgi:hypothetical protein